MKIYLASSPGCSKPEAKKQEKFIGKMKAHRLFSFYRIEVDSAEKHRLKISMKRKNK
jgi:hypothetical protein